MLYLSLAGCFAADVEPGNGGGVAAGFDGEFFAAVQDPVVGVFDDDGDEWGHGEDSIYFDSANNCWTAAVSLGCTPDGKRKRRKVTQDQNPGP